MNIFLGIILLIAALFLIVAVLLQNGKSKGTGVVTGGAETFFGKTKGKSIDKKLSVMTTIVAIVFVLLVIIVFVTQDTSLNTDTDHVHTSSTATNTGSDSLKYDSASSDKALTSDKADTSAAGQ